MEASFKDFYQERDCYQWLQGCPLLFLWISVLCDCQHHLLCISQECLLLSYTLPSFLLMAQDFQVCTLERTKGEIVLEQTYRLEQTATESQHESSAASSGSRGCPEDGNSAIASIGVIVDDEMQDSVS